MRTTLRTIAIVSFVVLVVDFLTLENRVVTTNPVAQGFGRSVGLLALAGLVCSSTLLIVGSLTRLVSKTDVRGDHSLPAGGTGRRTHAYSVSGCLHEPARSPSEASQTAVTRTRFRAVKVVIGLLVLASWFIGMPLYAYRTLIVKAPDFTPGPWVADVFLSVFAVAVQYAAPTPVAFAFWPSTAMATYLVFSRKDRPVLDALFGVAAVGLVFVLWYIMIRGIDLGVVR